MDFKIHSLIILMTLFIRGLFEKFLREVLGRIR